MIYNDHFFAIEDQVGQLVNQIIKSSSFNAYIQAKKMMHHDATVAKLRQEFTQHKGSFERIESYGKYAPDYREKQRALRKSKRALDLHPLVAQYRLAETQLQGLLDEISLKVAAIFSEDIIVETGNPFFESKSGCKGGCSHG
ncbi:MAG: YlbF family regulator [Enterococcus sp.]|nr:YlbF family regulator [Enterococcus sp.]